MAADRGLALLHLEDLLSIGHLVEPQLLCYLRAHLGRVAVDSLSATDDDIHIANLLDGRGQCIGCGQRIGTSVQSLADDLARARRTHRQQAYRAPRVLLLEAQGLLQRIKVFGIEDGGQSGAIHRSFGRHRIFAHVSRVGYLLGKYNNL